MRIKSKKDKYSKEPCLHEASIFICFDIQYEDDNGDVQNTNPPTHWYKKEA